MKSASIVAPTAQREPEVLRSTARSEEGERKMAVSSQKSVEGDAERILRQAFDGEDTADTVVGAERASHNLDAVASDDDETSADGGITVVVSTEDREPTDAEL